MRKRKKKEGTVHKRRQKGKRTKEKRTTRETKKERKMGVTQVDNLVHIWEHLEIRKESAEREQQRKREIDEWVKRTRFEKSALLWEKLQRKEIGKNKRKKHSE